MVIVERFNFRVFLSVCLFGWVVLGCAVTTFGGGRVPSSLMEPTVESQMISAYLLNSVQPNREHAIRIAQELQTIRDRKTKNDLASPSVRFRPRYEWSELIVGLTRAAVKDVKKHGGFLWKEVNSRYGIEIEGSKWSSGGRSCVLQFKGVVNPALLVAEYEALPGVEYANLSLFMYTTWGPGSTGLFPLEDNGQRSYMFVVAPRESNGRLIGTEYWYFIAGRSTVVQVGYWNKNEHGNSPNWLPKVQEARDYYKTH